MEAHEVHWNALPEPVRSRLSSCLYGDKHPKPVLEDTRQDPRIAFLRLLLLLGGALTLFTVTYVGFGRVRGLWAIQSPLWLLVYVPAVACVVSGSIVMLRRRRLAKALPYPSGRYILPTDFIDARTERLRIIPLSQVSRVQVRHVQQANGYYSHTSFLFDFGGKHREVFMVDDQVTAEQAVEQLARNTERVREAAAQQDAGKLVSLDPLYPVRAAGWDSLPKAPPAKPTGEVAGRLSPILRDPARSTLVLTLLLSVGLWGGRNYASDARIYESITTQESEYRYEWYIEAWGWHAREIEAVRLPALVLREASSVSDYRAFVERFPLSPLVVDAEEAITELYARALSRFKEQASTADPRVIPTMEQLLAWQEVHLSPPVPVRFRPPSSEALALLDALLTQEGATIDGIPIAPIAPHFSEERSEYREKNITRVLQGGFSTIFPDDVLTLEHGERLSGDDAPDAEQPAIVVAYTVSPSETVFQDEEGSRMYVGIVVDFDFEVHVPGAEEELDFVLSVEPPDSFSVSYTVMAELKDLPPTDGEVYTVMAARAFDKLSQQLTRAFFQEGSAAYRATERAQQR